MTRSRLHLLVITTWVVMKASAQDPQFSQWYAAPQYLNPALTGNTHQDRIALNYRLQWPGVQPGYETYMAAYDHRFSTVNAGMGGMVLRDKAGTSGLTTTTIGLNYAYEARLNYKRAIRFGARMGYTMRGVDPSGYLFADQVIRDNAAVTIEPNLVQRINYLDLAGGALYFSERFWAGLSVNHLNRPNTSLMIDGDARMERRTSIHAGYRFSTNGQHYSKSETRMTVATHYKMQGKWDQLDLGWYIDHKQLTGGLWYRGLPMVKAYKPGYGNNEAIVAMIGYTTENQLRLVYSYDITISKLSMRSAGAHEISLIYEWPKQVKKRKHRIVPCPKF
ncbi:MAG: type IX secretion system membrane protein PorP/SprF [Flavobacteriales bacterium]|nr:type IX secretion system membrane protein PorP/SprF [Flavobacteriales bacterium]